MSDNTQVVELPALFKCLVTKMTQEWRSRVPDNVTMTQFRVLRIIQSDGSKKTTELAEALGVTPGAVTGIADKLIDRGLVERKRDAQDRRVVYLDMTEDGRQYLNGLIERQKETLDFFFGSLPEEDVEHLERIFTSLLHKFGEKEEG